MIFVPDTNLLVYMFDHREPVKQNSAQLVFDRLKASGECLLLLQSIGEFISVSRRKLKMEPQSAAEKAAVFMEVFKTAGYTKGDLNIACNLMSEGRFSFWDGVMVATAVSSGCDVFISEDMQAGTRLAQMQIMSPFAEDGAPTPELMAMLVKT